MDDGDRNDAAVLIPAGAPIGDAAAWVGRSCWAELRLHEVLTGWLAVEADPEASVALWAVRAHRGELAAQWHRRLPELREMPRAGQVVAGPDDLVARLDRSAGLLAPEAAPARRDALLDLLDALAERYRAHRSVAVGPADGPVARTLGLAIDLTVDDRSRVAQVSFSRT